MKTLIIVWVLVVNYHPIDHDRIYGQYTSKALCEQWGKILQREIDKIHRAKGETTDPRGAVFRDGHSMTYWCITEDELKMPD